MLKNDAEIKARPDQIDQLVSKRLKNRRIILGISQQALGDAVGVSIQQIQKYEKGVNRISSGRLYSFAKYLKVPVSYFFDSSASSGHYIVAEEQAKYNSNDVSSKASEKETLAIISLFHKLSDTKRKAVMEMVKEMAKNGA